MERQDLLGFLDIEQRVAAIEAIEDETKVDISTRIAKALTYDHEIVELSALLRSGDAGAINALLGLVLNTDDNDEYGVGQDGEDPEKAKAIRELADAIKEAIEDGEIVIAIAGPATTFVEGLAENEDENIVAALDQMRATVTELVENADDGVKIALNVLLAAIPEPEAEEDVPKEEVVAEEAAAEEGQ